jgi:hypothetical protein
MDNFFAILLPKFWWVE